MFLLSQKKAEAEVRPYFSGIVSSFPIILGYFPVALAFGLAAKAAGLSPLTAVFISIFIFAGASQFALVGMLGSGASFILASLVCLALNARHLVYGPTLSSKFDEKSRRYSSFLSFGLTDEVFSTALGEMGKWKDRGQAGWMLGLETGAYFSWVIGTWLGAFFGDVVVSYLPVMESGLAFALPALFLTLLFFMVDRKTIIPVIVSGIVAMTFIKLNLSVYAIPGAAIAGPCVWALLRR